MQASDLWPLHRVPSTRTHCSILNHGQHILSNAHQEVAAVCEDPVSDPVHRHPRFPVQF